MLTTSQFFYDTCFFKFSLEFFQCSFDVLAIFYWYNNHILLFVFVIKLLKIGLSPVIAAAKLHSFFETTKKTFIFFSFLHLKTF